MERILREGRGEERSRGAGAGSERRRNDTRESISQEDQKMRIKRNIIEEKYEMRGEKERRGAQGRA